MTAAAVQAPAHVKNRAFLAWLEEVVALCQPADLHWCDGTDEEYDRLCARLVEGGTFRQLNPEHRPNSYLAWSDPTDVARVEDRTFICCQAQGGRGPHQQLGGAGRDEGHPEGPVQGLHAGPHPLCDPLQHGPAGQPHRPHRRGALRLALRGGEHADHDPHGQPGLGCAGRRRLRARPALAWACRWPRGRRTCPGPATARSTSSTSPRSAASGASAAATAATPSWGRSASPCASPASWPGTRAGSPSTC